VHSFAADQLAADFVMEAGLAFDHDDLAPGAREVCGDGAASDAAPITSAWTMSVMRPCRSKRVEKQAPRRFGVMLALRHLTPR
jgi:hypothetical protein